MPIFNQERTYRQPKRKPFDAMNEGGDALTKAKSQTDLASQISQIEEKIKYIKQAQNDQISMKTVQPQGQS